MKDNKQKVLIFGSYSDSLINFRFDLIRELMNRDFQVIAISPIDNKFRQTKAKLLSINVDLIGIKLSRAGLNPYKDLKSLFDFFLLVRRIKPNIVISYTVKPNIVVGLTKFIFNKFSFFPMITGLGYGFTEGKGIKRFIVSIIIKPLYSIALNMANVILFQNKDDLDFFKVSGITSSDALCKVIDGSGVNQKKFQMTQLPKKNIFLMLSRLVKDKGVLEYLEAARLIKQKD